MRQGYIIGIFLLFTSIAYAQPAIQEVYLPQYVQGAGTGTAARVPYVCRLKITGLQPGKTYRYFNRFVVAGADTSNQGEGAFIVVKQTGDFARINGPNLGSPSLSGTLAADASGNYTGWFMAEVAASNTFAPGGKVKMKVLLNNGGTGLSVNHRLATTQEITVVNFGTTTAANECTAIRSTAVTGATAKNFVLLWDKTTVDSAVDRPIAGAVVESDGFNTNTGTLGYAAFYNTDVNGIDKTWGTIIPNNLANGIKRISQYSLAAGGEVGYKISNTAFWPVVGGTRINTVGVTGGQANVIVLDGAIARLDGDNVKSNQTITFNSLPAKTYGDTDFDPAVTTSIGLPAVYASDNASVATIVNNQVHIAGAGTATISASHPGDDFYNAAAPVPQQLTVNKKDLTIRARDESMVEGDPIPAFTLIYTGFIPGENESVLTTPPAVTTTATSGSAAGNTYPIEVCCAVAANYDIQYQQGGLTITSAKQPQTITFTGLPVKTYGDADFDPGAAINSPLDITYTSSDLNVARIVNGKISITGAGTTTITASQDGNSGWFAATPVTVPFTVDKASLTIKADDKTRKVGLPNPSFTFTYTGFVNNENNTVLIAQPTGSTAADINSLPGVYDIDVTGAAANNYEIGYEKGVLTVEAKNSQTITFAALPVKKYGDAPFNLSANASSGLGITFTSSNPEVADVSGNRVTIKGAGAATITATQTGNDQYAAATAVVNTLTVQKAVLNIQAVNSTKKEGEANPPLTAAYSGFVNGDDASKLTTLPSITTTATTASVPGAYTILVQGATSQNYAIVQINGTLTVLPQQGNAQDNVVAYMAAPGALQVNVYAVNAAKGAIQLFDQNGYRLVNQPVTFSAGANSLRLPVNKLMPGIYHVRAAVGQVLLKTKLIIQ